MRGTRRERLVGTGSVSHWGCTAFGGLRAQMHAWMDEADVRSGRGGRSVDCTGAAEERGGGARGRRDVSGDSAGGADWCRCEGGGVSARERGTCMEGGGTTGSEEVTGRPRGAHGMQTRRLTVRARLCST